METASAADAKEKARIKLIRSFPASCRIRVLCVSCMPDPKTGLRPESCKCKGSGFVRGDKLIRLPADSIRNCRCQECAALLARGRIGWICPNGCQGKIIDDGTMKQIVTKQFAEFKLRGQWMMKTGVDESSIESPPGT